MTTEVIGVDGLSYAPFTRAEDLAAQVEMNAGLDGRPDVALDWDTVASYLGRFDGQVAVNVAMLIGNSALRICAIGWDDLPADDRTQADMRAMLREGMAEGAFGLSTGLDYPPGSYATTEELADLTAAAAADGGFYHTHVRYELGDRYLDPFREALTIGQTGPGPVHLTHFYHRRNYPGGHEPMLGLVDDARAAGQDVTFDTYPYEWASTRLLIQLPQWVQAGGPGPLKERLADGGIRARLREEMTRHDPVHGAPLTWADVRLGAFISAANQQWEGRTLEEVGLETDRRPDRRHLRPAAGRGSPPEPGHARTVVRVTPPFRGPPGRDGRHRLDVHRSEAVPADLRLLPPDPGPVRPRRGPALARGGRAQDDLRPCRSPGSAAIAACCATATSPTSWCSTRPGSARTPPTTSRANIPTGSSTSSSTGSRWWTVAATPGRGPAVPFATGATRSRLDTMRP